MTITGCANLQLMVIIKVYLKYRLSLPPKPPNEVISIMVGYIQGQGVPYMVGYII